MGYLARPATNRQTLQRQIVTLLEANEAIWVESSYLDPAITARPAALIDPLARPGIRVEGMTWCCHVLPERRARLGCPQGCGGPRAHDGWFYECPHFEEFWMVDRGVDLEALDASPDVLVEAARDTAHVILTDDPPSTPSSSPCPCPGLWLHVPDDRNRGAR